MSNINKIRLSGQTYNIQDLNATKTVELTQAEYDALSQKDPNVFYIITDATAGDLSNYYTKTETDNAITAATSTKQDTLVSGTNIKTINGETLLGEGNITIEGGSGGGKAIEAGRGISITTGETSNTVSFNLPISAGTGTNSIIEGSADLAIGISSHAEGTQTIASSENSHAEGENTSANGKGSHAEGCLSSANGEYSHSEGFFARANGKDSHAEGMSTIANNMAEHASGQYNNSVSASTTFGDSDNTLFSVGNGTSDSARHNAFEIRQNGDIYIVDTNDTSTTNYYEKPMIKLQNAIGGGGSSYTAGDGIDITNDVISVTGKVDTSAITTSVTSSSTDSQVPSAKAVYDIVGNIETLLSKI